MQSLLENRSEMIEWVGITPVEYSLSDRTFFYIADTLDPSRWEDFCDGPTTVQDYFKLIRGWATPSQDIELGHRIYGVRFQYRGDIPGPREVEGDHFRHGWRPAFTHELIGFCTWLAANRRPWDDGALVTSVSSYHRMRHSRWGWDAFLAVRKVAKEPGWKMTYVCFGGPSRIWFEEEGIVEDPIFLAVAP